MLKLEKIIQLLLLAMLTQTGLLLMLHPMPHRLVFSQANLLFMVGLLGLLFCCAFYFSRELQEIKDSLRQSSNYRHLLFLYFLMILVNAAGVLLLCGKEVQSGRAVEQMLTESFLFCFWGLTSPFYPLQHRNLLTVTPLFAIGRAGGLH